MRAGIWQTVLSVSPCSALLMPGGVVWGLYGVGLLGDIVLGTSPCWGRLLYWSGTSCWEHLLAGDVRRVGWGVSVLGTSPLLAGDISPVGRAHLTLPGSAHRCGRQEVPRAPLDAVVQLSPVGLSEAKPKPKNLMVCFHCPKVLATSLPVTVLLAGRPC